MPNIKTKKKTKLLVKVGMHLVAHEQYEHNYKCLEDPESPMLRRSPEEQAAEFINNNEFPVTLTQLSKEIVDDLQNFNFPQDVSTGFKNREQITSDPIVQLRDDNITTFLEFYIKGSNHLPVFAILYLDDTETLRAFIPERGNKYNTFNRCLYSDPPTEEDIENMKLNAKETTNEWKVPDIQFLYEDLYEAIQIKLSGKDAVSAETVEEENVEEVSETQELDKEPRLMSAQEFVDSGLFQELLRKFLHPLGYDLSVEAGPTGKLQLGKILDYTNTEDAWPSFTEEELVSEEFKKNVKKIGRLRMDSGHKSAIRRGIIQQEPLTKTEDIPPSQKLKGVIFNLDDVSQLSELDIEYTKSFDEEAFNEDLGAFVFDFTMLTSEQLVIGLNNKLDELYILGVLDGAVGAIEQRFGRTHTIKAVETENEDIEWLYDYREIYKKTKEEVDSQKAEENPSEE